MKFKFLYPFFVLFCIGCSTRPLAGDGVDAAQMSQTCSIELGVEWATKKQPYTGFCSQSSENLFLSGYRMGRKLSWVENDLYEVNRKIFCLDQERHLKFARTLSPVHIDFGTDHELHKSLNEDKCNSGVLTTEAGLANEIKESQKVLPKLLAKKMSLQTLIDKSILNPNALPQLIQKYESETPIDELDIHLQWKPYVSKKGGYKSLDLATKELILAEISKKPELPMDLLRGSLIGFGVGHHRQGRFSSTGWKYAVLDTAILGSLIHGISAPDSSAAFIIVGVLGIPLSRQFQLVDVYDYNTETTIDLESLKTQRRPTIKQLVYTWNW